MMIKCQKCGFENQMGSIFCRECGEKLNMDAIDPNKLQKDVDKEKNIKRAKKRIKEAISTGFALLVVVAFVFLVFPDLFPVGKMRQYEEPAVTEAAANQKFNAAATGTAAGKVKYTYPELTRMFNLKVVDPLSEMDSFAKVTNAEITYDAEKNHPVIYLWISLKDKVPVVYTIHGNLVFNASDDPTSGASPLTLDVKRLDIGRLPVFVSTNSFLDGFSTLIENGEVGNFFSRAKSVEFDGEGMTVEFSKGSGSSAPASSYAPKASASAGVAALKSGSTAALAEKNEADNAKAEAARAKAEAAKQKAAEEKEKQKQLEEERKRKAEEYRQQQKEKEEERKRKAEEEKARKQQEKEERERQIREENERRRQEREDRRRDRENNNYNNRNSRSSRSSRNRY